MGKRRKAPSAAAIARALLPLAGPILAGQPWLLLPAAVAGFLTLKDEENRRAWLESLVRNLPVEGAAALGGASAPGEGVLSEVEIWAGRITELVRREIAGLDIIAGEDGALARQVLETDVEALAGEVAEALKGAGGNLTPDGLVARLKDAFEPRLKPVARDSAGQIATTLARSIVVAMKDSPALRAPFIETHHDETARIARGVRDLLERQEDLGGQLGQVLEAARKAAGEPTEADVHAVAEQTRVRAREQAPRALVRQLCRPFGVEEATDLAGSHGTITCFGHGMPRWFEHVPHSFERWVPGPAGGGDARPDGQWMGCQLEEILEAIRATALPVRILVLGTAGFGKTTFMHWLACRLAEEDGAPVPLGPVRAGSGSLGEGRVHETLGAWSLEYCGFSGVTENEVYRKNLALALLRRGGGVLLVDGLDQIARASDAADALLSAEDAGRVVASCREETGLSLNDPRWSLVVRLRHPEEAVFEERVTPEVRERLEATVGQAIERPGYDREDLRHPFLLHVTRVVTLLGENEGVAAPGTAGLLDAYVRRLVHHGREHSGRRGPGAGDELVSDERRVLGTLGYLSMARLHRASSRSRELTDELQRLDGDVLAEARRESESVVSHGFDLDRFFDFTRDHAALVHVVEKSFALGKPIYSFHHQLVQEYLAALGISLRVGESKTPLDTLRELVAGVVSPSEPGADGRGEPIRDRVLGLHLWSMLGELMVTEKPELAKKLVPEISSWLLDRSEEAVSEGRFEPLELSPLLVVRDAMVEALDRSGVLAGEQIPHPDDPVVAQFQAAGVPPDPFMVLCWAEERRRIREQVASVADWILGELGTQGNVVGDALLEKLQEAVASGAVDRRIQAVAPVLEALLRRQEDRARKERRVAWKVREHGPTLAAFAPEAAKPSWLLVPHGPFLAGDVERGHELPVRVESVGRPFWIAHDPVTVGEYAEFMRVQDPHAGERRDDELEYDLAKGVWENFPAGPRGRMREWVKVFVRRGEITVQRESLEQEEQEMENRFERRQPWRWGCDSHEMPPDQPVSGVSTFEAGAFCLWRNGVQGKVSGWCGPHRLPGEAEWEKAARGLVGRRWPWGCAWRRELAACRENRELRYPVSVAGNLNCSPFGVRGMAGSVTEWTMGSMFQRRPFRATTSFRSLFELEENLARGGSFLEDRLDVRCASRIPAPLGFNTGHNWGFRCLREVF